MHSSLAVNDQAPAKYCHPVSPDWDDQPKSLINIGYVAKKGEAGMPRANQSCKQLMQRIYKHKFLQSSHSYSCNFFYCVYVFDS
jgi:hypothetical protein